MSAVHSSAGSENVQSMIALHFPDGRELLWVTRDSPLFAWQVGQPVVFRNTEWIVVGRADSERDGSITLRLGVAA
jgi:hypothetical protein